MMKAAERIYPGLELGGEATDDAIASQRRRARRFSKARRHQRYLHLDDGVVLAILALEPTIVDVEEASMWLAGDRDVFGAGRPLRGVASQIVTLLTAGEEEEASRSR
jgi:hypothetical protein